MNVEDKLTAIKENLEEIQNILEPLLENVESQLLSPPDRKASDSIEDSCILDTLNNVLRDGSYLRKIIMEVMKKSQNTIKSVKKEKVEEEYTYDFEC